MTFWISPDAIANRLGSDAKSIAELIMHGIARKLGPEAVHFPELTIRQLREEAIERQVAPQEFEEQRLKEFFIKLKNQRRAGITLRIAPNSRVIGWQYCREALRWTPIGEQRPIFDPEIYQHLFSADLHRAMEYLKLFQSREQEVLPQLQIWDEDPRYPLYGCPRLIFAIPQARHAEPPEDVEDITKKHWDGADECDSLRYLLMGVQEGESGDEPYESWRDRELTRLDLERGSTSPGQPISTVDLIWANRHLEARWDLEKKGNGGPVIVPRKSRMGRLGGMDPYARVLDKLLPGKGF